MNDHAIHGIMPDDVREFSRTKLFTEQTTPDKMRKHHSLARNTWGLLNVKSGELKFTLEDRNIEIDLKPSQSVVIEPEIMHFVTISSPVTFDITFFKKNEDIRESSCCSGPSR